MIGHLQIFEIPDRKQIPIDVVAEPCFRVREFCVPMLMHKLVAPALEGLHIEYDRNDAFRSTEELMC